MRYEDVDATTQDMVNEIVAKNFPALTNAIIAVVFDLKKRMSKGSYTLGRLKKTNENEKFLSATNAYPDGFDYILYLDKAVFLSIEDVDKIRLIRHELQHADVDIEKDNPYGIRDHEVTDFYEEIELNKDDPRWAERLATVADSIYSKDE